MMGNAGRVSARAFAALALVIGFAAAAAPASADIKINEIESQPTDWVEPTNTGAAAVDIGNYVLRDSGPTNPTTIPAGDDAPAGRVLLDRLHAGLGNPDAVRLFDAGGTMIDSYAYDDHARSTVWALPRRHRCVREHGGADAGRGDALPRPGSPWPGGAAISILDDAADVRRERQRAGLPAVRHGCAGRAVGGAQLQPVLALPAWSETGAAVAAPHRLHPRGSRYKNGLGDPDAEGVTLADGDATRCTSPPSATAAAASLPEVLRYDTSAVGATLSATNEWDLSLDLPGLGANLGLEAIAFVPDSLLVAKGRIDDAGAKYNPADLPQSRQRACSSSASSRPAR